MLSERLQILVTPEQRKRLTEESRRRGSSIGSLVRDAVDARYGWRFSQEDRLKALEGLRATTAARFASVEELEEIIAEEREANIPADLLDPPS